MEQAGADQILVVTAAGDQAAGQRRERGLAGTLTTRIVNSIGVSALKESMKSFFDQLREILDTGEDKIAAFQISQIEISAQITGDGKVCLLGSGASLEVQGGLKFVLERAKT